MTFLDKQRLRELITNRLSLKAMLNVFRQKENGIRWKLLFTKMKKKNA